jgi:hypothetical protein
LWEMALKKMNCESFRKILIFLLQNKSDYIN